MDIKQKISDILHEDQMVSFSRTLLKEFCKVGHFKNDPAVNRHTCNEMARKMVAEEFEDVALLLKSAINNWKEDRLEDENRTRSISKKISSLVGWLLIDYVQLDKVDADILKNKDRKDLVLAFNYETPSKMAAEMLYARVYKNYAQYKFSEESHELEGKFHINGAGLLPERGPDEKGLEVDDVIKAIYKEVYYDNPNSQKEVVEITEKLLKTMNSKIRFLVRSGENYYISIDSKANDHLRDADFQSMLQGKIRYLGILNINDTASANFLNIDDDDALGIVHSVLQLLPYF